MAQFTKTLASDFNTVRNTVANVLGTGAGTRGYGSPINSVTVAAGQKIRPTEFSSLTTDINACYRHINGANATTLANIVVGGKVSWANFVTYQAAATFIDNNRDSNNGAVTTPTPGSLVLPAGWGNANPTQRAAQATGTFSWPSAEAMRFFFNQAGVCTIRGSAPAGTANTKSRAFSTLANSIFVGVNVFSYRNNIGASQNAVTTQNPYSTGAASNINVIFSAPSGNTISFVIQCVDRGGDDGDADGTTVASNIDIALTFTAGPENISNTAGITQYIPSVSFSAWSYAA
jgi:hypothetical protein